MVVVNDSGSSNGSGRNDAGGASSRVDREWGMVGPVARTDGGK